jgi:hypothetical protein
MVEFDRVTTLPASPEVVWPWIVQLGKGRAGWYMTRRVERFLPRKAIRHIDPRWQTLQVGDRVPDYGGWFEVAEIDPPHRLVYRGHRGSFRYTWELRLAGSELHLRFAGSSDEWGPATTRVLRLFGGLMDYATTELMFAGLRERLIIQEPPTQTTLGRAR